MKLLQDKIDIIYNYKGKLIACNEQYICEFDLNFEISNKFSSNGVKIDRIFELENQLFGKDIYGKTYLIDRKLEFISDKFTNSINKEYKIIRESKNNYYIKKNDELVLSTDFKILSDTTIIDNKIIVTRKWYDFENQSLIAFSLDDGKIIWEKSGSYFNKQFGEGTNRIGQLICEKGDYILITSYENGSLLVINKQDGQVFHKIESNEYDIGFESFKNDLKIKAVGVLGEINLTTFNFVSRKLYLNILNQEEGTDQNYYSATSFDFNKNSLFFQVQNNYNVQTSKYKCENVIFQIDRISNKLVKKYFINTEKKSLNAETIFCMGKHLIILDVLGNLFKIEID